MSRRTAVSDWLAQSHDQPRQAHAEWAERGIAVLPTGGVFGAVRIPESLVRAAVESADNDHVGYVLADRLNGPVIHDGRGRNYYALLRPEDRLAWDTTAPGVEYLPPRTHLGVPAAGLCEYTTVTPVYWAVPVIRPSYCDLASLALLVRIGAARLAEARPGAAAAAALVGRTGMPPLTADQADGHPR
ncbi:hypothetical protein [Streptomyces sp. NPDC086023]|uniref:hypothetical protein n=1 Tax=Streptomyces sp. NPDC086023 TaxID=3365746 RepID=UPI0037D2D3FF